MQNRKLEKKKCRSCELNPNIIFSNLNKDLNSKLNDFVTRLNETLNSLIYRNMNRGYDKSCASCICETYKDLTFIFINYQDFSKRTFLEGFSVVLD